MQEMRVKVMKSDTPQIIIGEISYDSYNFDAYKLSGRLIDID